MKRTLIFLGLLSLLAQSIYAGQIVPLIDTATGLLTEFTIDLDDTEVLSQQTWHELLQQNNGEIQVTQLVTPLTTGGEGYTYFPQGLLDEWIASKGQQINPLTNLPYEANQSRLFILRWVDPVAAAQIQAAQEALNIFDKLANQYHIYVLDYQKTQVPPSQELTNLRNQLKTASNQPLTPSLHNQINLALAALYIYELGTPQNIPYAQQLLAPIATQDAKAKALFDAISQPEQVFYKIISEANQDSHPTEATINKVAALNALGHSLNKDIRLGAQFARALQWQVIFENRLADQDRLEAQKCLQQIITTENKFKGHALYLLAKLQITKADGSRATDQDKEIAREYLKQINKPYADIFYTAIFEIDTSIANHTINDEAERLLKSIRPDEEILQEFIEGDPANPYNSGLWKKINDLKDYPIVHFINTYKGDIERLNSWESNEAVREKAQAYYLYFTGWLQITGNLGRGNAGDPYSIYRNVPEGEKNIHEALVLAEKLQDTALIEKIKNALNREDEYTFYQKGMELANKKEYRKASKMFDKALYFAFEALAQTKQINYEFLEQIKLQRDLIINKLGEQAPQAMPSHLESTQQVTHSQENSPLAQHSQQEAEILKNKIQQIKGHIDNSADIKQTISLIEQLINNNLQLTDPTIIATAKAYGLYYLAVLQIEPNLLIKNKIENDPLECLIKSKNNLQIASEIANQLDDQNLIQAINAYTAFLNGAARILDGKYNEGVALLKEAFNNALMMKDEKLAKLAYTNIERILSINHAQNILNNLALNPKFDEQNKARKELVAALANNNYQQAQQLWQSLDASLPWSLIFDELKKHITNDAAQLFYSSGIKFTDTTNAKNYLTRALITATLNGYDNLAEQAQEALNKLAKN